MTSLLRQNVQFFIEHLKNAEKDSSLDEKIQQSAQKCIAYLSENIIELEEGFELSGSLDFHQLFPSSPMGKAVHDVTADGYGKVLEFLRARPSAQLGS